MRPSAVVLVLLLLAPGLPTPGPRALAQGAGVQGRTISVREGDTLEALAQRHGVSLEALAEANQLKDTNQLTVGQRLVLPPSGPGVAIRSGDTLDALASRYGTTTATLQRLNPALQPDSLPVGAWLKLPKGSRAAVGSPAAISTPATPTPVAPAVPPPPAGTGEQTAAAALLLSPAERRDRAEVSLREQSGRARWRRFGSTEVDWAGWRLHPGGVRITLVKPSLADVGVRRSGATAVAVQCESLRQTWRIEGTWEGWAPPEPKSVGQRIVIDLCSNTLDAPAQPVAP
ncbi:MAG: LysM peptidoglycan-binding domain-containing protein [Synechococcaceae cyanobacterium ELA445]